MSDEIRQMCSAYQERCGYCKLVNRHEGRCQFPPRRCVVTLNLRGGMLTRLETEATSRGMGLEALALEILNEWRPKRGYK